MQAVSAARLRLSVLIIQPKLLKREILLNSSNKVKKKKVGIAPTVSFCLKFIDLSDCVLKNFQRIGGINPFIIIDVRKCNLL